MNSILNLSSGYFSQIYGWNQGNMISLSSYFGWINVLLMMVFGQMLMKVSPRIMSLGASITYCATIFWYPSITQYWQFVTVLGVVMILNFVWTIQINSVIISNWFPRKKGMVMGYVALGLAFGTATGVFLYNALFHAVGFAGVHYVYGAIGIVVVLMAIFIVKDFPEQCGAFPDNDKTMTREQANMMLAEGMKMAKNSVWTVKNMLATKETWLIGFGCGVIGLFAGAFTTQMIPRLSALNYEMNVAVGIMTGAMLLACVGSYVCGVLISKLGARTAILIVLVASIIACILYIIPNFACIVISLAFVGLVLGGSANFLVSMISTYWGRFGFVNAQRVVMPINSIIGSGGGVLVAQIAMRTSYAGAYLTVGIVSTIGFILIFLAKDNSIARRQEQLETARNTKEASN
jgi:MFS family permease